MKRQKTTDKEFKRRRAIRELNQQGITTYKGKDLDNVILKDLLDYYKEVFGKDVERRTREKTKQKLSGQIYIIGNLEQLVCKIGYSNNPNERVKSLQTSCPFKLTIMASFSVNIPLEKQLHKKYAHLNVMGEWFRIDEVLSEIIKDNDYYKIKPKK